MGKKVKNIVVGFLVIAVIILIVKIVINSGDYSAYGFNSKDEIIKYLDENQVSKDKQIILLKKLRNDKLWDCFIEEKINQVPKHFYEFEPKNGSEVRYYRFEDGSFIKLEAILEDETKIDGTQESMEMLKVKFMKENLVYEEIIKDIEYQGNEGDANLYNYKIIYQKGSMMASLNTEFIIIGGIYNEYIVFGGSHNPIITGFEVDRIPTMEYVREKENYHSYAIVSSVWQGYGLKTIWNYGSLENGATYRLYLAVGNDKFVISNRLYFEL